MVYSSLFNQTADLHYDVYLDGVLVKEKVPSYHIESLIFALERQGENIVDEIWDEEALRVDLSSTDFLDDDEREEEEW